MKKTNLILAGIIVFALSLTGVYVYAQTSEVSHPAGQIKSGTFGSAVGDTKGYNFPSYIHIGTNDTWLPWNGNNQNYIRGIINTNNAIVAEGVGTIRDSGGGWVRTYGNTGWYNQSHNGGWSMSDNSWMRSYNDKPIYSGGEIRSGTLVRSLGDVMASNNIRASNNVVSSEGASSEIYLTRIGAQPRIKFGGEYASAAYLDTPTNLFIRTLTSYDVTALHVRKINTTSIGNSWYGGNVRVYFGANDTGGGSNSNQTINSPCGGGSVFCVRDYGGGDTAQIHARELHTTTLVYDNLVKRSSEKYKTGISLLDSKNYNHVLNVLKNTNLYSYSWKDKGINNGNATIGLIAEKTPKEFSNGESIDMDSYTNYIFAGVKGLISENEEQQKEIEELKKKVEKLESSNRGAQSTSLWNRLLGK